MAGRRAQPVTLASIGKGIFSALFFPLNFLVTSCAYVGTKCAEYGHFIAAFFTGKDSWIGRTLNASPFFKSIYDNSKKFLDSVAGFTFFAATEPLKHVNETSNRVLHHVTPLVSENHHTPHRLSDKEDIKNHSRPSPDCQPTSCLGFITKVFGLGK